MEKKDSKYKVEIDNKASFDIDWRSLDIDVYHSTDNNINFLKDNVNYKAKLLAFDPRSKEMKISINEQSYTILIKDELDLRIEEMGLETTVVNHIKELIAPMPGQIKEVLVKAGDQVEEGAPLLVLVAMKMENLLKSPNSGTIESIHINEEQIVNKGDVLIRFA